MYFRFHHDPNTHHLRVEVLRALHNRDLDEAMLEFRSFYSSVPEPQMYVFCFAACTHCAYKFFCAMLQLSRMFHVQCCCLNGGTRMVFETLRLGIRIPEIPHDESVSSKAKS